MEKNLNLGTIRCEIYHAYVFIIFFIQCKQNKQ